jgi:hypothetical protein
MPREVKYDDYINEGFDDWLKKNKGVKKQDSFNPN